MKVMISKKLKMLTRLKKSSFDIDYTQSKQASTYLSDSKVLNDKYLNIVVGASGGSKGWWSRTTIKQLRRI